MIALQRPRLPQIKSVCAMERASEQIHASNAADRVDAVQGHRIPPLWPHRVVLSRKSY